MSDLLDVLHKLGDAMRESGQPLVIQFSSRKARDLFGEAIEWALSAPGGTVLRATGVKRCMFDGVEFTVAGEGESELAQKVRTATARDVEAIMSRNNELELLAKERLNGLLAAAVLGAALTREIHRAEEADGHS